MARRIAAAGLDADAFRALIEYGNASALPQGCSQWPG